MVLLACLEAQAIALNLFQGGKSRQPKARCCAQAQAGNCQLEQQRRFLREAKANQRAETGNPPGCNPRSCP